MNRYHLTPVAWSTAKEFVGDWHRHHPKPPAGHKFSIGLADDNNLLVGVAIVGRPSCRHHQDGETLEVTRCCVAPGTPNGCSMLYGACIRAAHALGYTRVITFTRADESGTSLRASGWRIIAQRPAHGPWTGHSATPSDGVPHTLWEAVA